MQRQEWEEQKKRKRMKANRLQHNQKLVLTDRRQPFFSFITKQLKLKRTLFLFFNEKNLLFREIDEKRFVKLKHGERETSEKKNLFYEKGD